MKKRQILNGGISRCQKLADKIKFLMLKEIDDLENIDLHITN